MLFRVAGVKAVGVAVAVVLLAVGGWFAGQVFVRSWKGCSYPAAVAFLVEHFGRSPSAKAVQR